LTLLDLSRRQLASRSLVEMMRPGEITRTG
jgi:hypothetical protein